VGCASETAIEFPEILELDNEFFVPVWWEVLQAKVSRFDIFFDDQINKQMTN